VSERERRIGLNEAVYREVNEKLRAVNEVFATITDSFEIMCECGHATCDDRFSIAPDAYEELRRDPVLFAVVPGHEIPDVEDVLARTEAYAVVRKRPGDPAKVAAQTDPRS
jgi:hypothetical protein